jgi:hypothetical protein
LLGGPSQENEKDALVASERRPRASGAAARQGERTARKGEVEIDARRGGGATAAERSDPILLATAVVVDDDRTRSVEDADVLAGWLAVAAAGSFVVIGRGRSLAKPPDSLLFGITT